MKVYVITIPDQATLHAQLRGQPVRPRQIWADRRKEQSRKACRGRIRE